MRAYCDLIDRTKKLFKKASRFNQENIKPIFQHYGLKTTWLDLVDNVFVALWFATRKFHSENGTHKAHYEISPESSEYLYFYATSAETEYFDLRKGNSSLSLRLHAQHGISLTRKIIKWTIENRNLDDHLIGTVKFPNNDKWRPSGEIFSTGFLFPSPELDNTFKYLKKTKFSDLLSEIIDKYGLDENELGSITNYE